MDMNGGISLNNNYVLISHSHVNRGMNSHERGNISYGIKHLTAGSHGHPQTFAASDFGHPPVFVIDFHDPKTRRCFLPECHLAITNILGKVNKKGSFLLFNHKLRFTRHYLHRNTTRFFQKDQRMPHQSWQGLVHLKGTATIS